MSVRQSTESAWPIYRRLLTYTRGYYWALSIAIVGMLFEAGATSAFAALLRPLLDQGFVGQDATMIRILPFLVAAIFVVRGAGAFASEYAMALVGRSVIRDMRGDLFGHYLLLPSSFYDRHSTGELISRLTYNIEQVAEASTNAITIAIKDSLYVIFLLAIMFYQSVTLTLASLIIGPVIAVVIVFVSRRFRRLSRKIQDSISGVSHRAAQIVEGQKEIKIYGGRATEKSQFHDINSNNRVQHLKLVATKAASTSLVQLFAGLALAAIIYVATLDSMLDRITPGAFVAFMTAMLGILPSLKRLTNVQVNIQKGVAAADSIFEVLDLEVETDRGASSVSRAKGNVSFRDVSFHYASSKDLAVDSLSFEAAPGTVTAVVGRSGSGKSSLVKLLARFYRPTNGEIWLDDAEIGSYRLSDYREQIAFVSQDVVLFEDTIGRNIAYGAMADATVDDIRRAAEQAAAIEFIDALPQGLDTRIGESGFQLSGGQRQRIAIARAILKNAPILVLDEATSALDTESERAIQAALLAVMRDKTTIVIAHRLSTIENADQVLVMENGRLLEVGSHEQLLGANGHYAALHRLQFSSQAGEGHESSDH